MNKMLSKLIITFLLLSIFPGILGFSRLEIKRNKARFEAYHKCIQERLEVFRRNRDSQLIKSKIVTFKDDATLPCLICPTPAEEDLVEDIWKPSENILGRKLGNVWQKFKKYARDSNKTVPSFVWEFKAIQKEAKWKPVIDLTEPRTYARMAAKAFKRILKPNKKFSIGDHFELKITNASWPDSGFYRCVRRTPNEFISNMIFMEVQQPGVLVVREDTGEIKFDNTSLAVLKMFDELGVVAFRSPSSWTECNKCEEEGGERFRRVECRLKGVQKSTLSNPLRALLRLFGDLSCSSSLLPRELRRKLAKFPIIEEFQSCKAECPKPLKETRFIEKIDRIGRKVVIDEVPEGEFSFLERLPPLRRSVKRKLVKTKEGDDLLILSCGEQSIFWHRDFISVLQKDLLDDFNKAHLTVEGDYVIRNLNLNDSGLYSCFRPPKTLLKSFRVIVKEGDPTQRVVEYSRMMIRFAASFLLLVLIVGLLASKR